VNVNDGCVMNSEETKTTTTTSFGIIQSTMEGLIPTTITQCPETFMDYSEIDTDRDLHGKVESMVTKRLDNSIGNIKEQDKILETIAGTLWNPAQAEGKYFLANLIWENTFHIIYEWEQNHPGQRVHKGTGYYFWAVTCIQAGALEKGFLLMHQALEEDKNSYGVPDPPTPAHAFVTLNHKKKSQYFRDKVMQVAQFVDEKLIEYRSERGMVLSFSDFRAKFLKNKTLQEEVFSFVYEAFHLRVLSTDIHQNLTHNTFGSLSQTKTLLSLCLIIENVIALKNPKKRQFSDHIIFLCNQAGLSLNINKVKEQLNHEGFKKDFPGTLQKIIDSKYTFLDGSPLLLIEGDLAITYGFRNFGAHRLEDQPIIYKRFAEFVQKILNVLFFSIEKLY